MRVGFLARSIREVVPVTAFRHEEIVHYSIPAFDASGGPAIVAGTEIESDKLAVQMGDVLISRLNPRKSRVQRVVQTGQWTLSSTEFVVLRPHAVDARYLAYLLRSEGTRQYLDAEVRSVTRSQQRVDVEHVLRVPVPETDIERQARIADGLDRECERIEMLEDRLGRTEAVVAEEVASVIGERIDATAGPVRPLAWAVDTTRPIMYGIVLPGEPVSDGVLLVKGGNVERSELDPHHLASVAREIERPYARARLQGGDLLMTIRGSYGAVAAVPPASAGANITQDTARIAPARHVNPTYLLHVLRSWRTQREIGARVRGTGVRGLNIYDVKRLPIPLPDRPEQDRLAAEFDERWAKQLACRAALAQLRLRIAEYRDALIGEAVTGQVDMTKISEAQLDERLHAAVEGAEKTGTSTPAAR